jgi:hypothetical protein
VFHRHEYPDLCAQSKSGDQTGPGNGVDSGTLGEQVWVNQHTSFARTLRERVTEGGETGFTSRNEDTIGGVFSVGSIRKYGAFHRPGFGIGGAVPDFILGCIDFAGSAKRRSEDFIFRRLLARAVVCRGESYQSFCLKEKAQE